MPRQACERISNFVCYVKTEGTGDWQGQRRRGEGGAGCRRRRRERAPSEAGGAQFIAEEGGLEIGRGSGERRSSRRKSLPNVLERLPKGVSSDVKGAGSEREPGTRRESASSERRERRERRELKQPCVRSGSAAGQGDG